MFFGAIKAKGIASATNKTIIILRHAAFKSKNVWHAWRTIG